MRAAIFVGAAVLAWFALAELGTHIWYVSHEAKAPLNRLPASGQAVADKLRVFLESDGNSVKSTEVDELAMGTLKASFGRTLMWRENGSVAVVTILGWDQRNAVGGAETMHNPGKCLRATGWSVGAHTDFGLEDFCGTNCDVAQWEVNRDDLRMLAFSGVLRRFAGVPHKFDTLFRYANRLRSVVDGKRDAPMFIILAYLPLTSAEDTGAVRARFQDILQTVLCEPSTRLEENRGVPKARQVRLSQNQKIGGSDS